MDPSEIVTEKGEETRPITNMSPWISVYESVRYDDANRAREAIMNEDLHGARKECEIYGVSLDLAIQIDEAVEDGDDVVGWVVDKDGRINFPDQQLRIYKNDPERIYWTKPVHEQLVGYTKYAALPGNEEYCLHHPKDIKRQEKQNNFYDTI